MNNISRWKQPGFLIATFFGVGLLPKAPGTWGSLCGLGFGVIILMLANLGTLLFPTSDSFIVITIIATLLIISTFLIGIWASNWYERYTQQHDSGAIVIDEVLGQALVYLLTSPASLIAPPLTTLGTVIMFALLFLLFRFFDIFKPWPIGWFDRTIPGGLGVMVDDIVAAIMASVCFYVILFITLDIYL